MAVNKVETSIAENVNRYICYCYVCAEHIQTYWDVHCNNETHKRAMMLFDKDFTTLDSVIECNVCKKQVTWEHVSEHAREHKVIPWNRQFMTLCMNSINIHNTIYHCNLCGRSLPDWQTLTDHIFSKFHIMLRCVSPRFQEVVETYQEESELFFAEVANNYMSIYSVNIFQCQICEHMIEGVKNMRQHIPIHLMPGSLIIYPPINTIRMPANINVSRGIAYAARILCFLIRQGMLYCRICDLWMEDEVAVKSHVKVHLRKVYARYEKSIKKTNLNETLYSIKTIKRITMRTVPKKFFWMLKTHSIKVGLSSLYCEHCGVTMVNDAAVRNHLHSHIKLVAIGKLPSKSAEPLQPLETQHNLSMKKSSMSARYLFFNKDYMFNWLPEIDWKLKRSAYLTVVSTNESSSRNIVFCLACSKLFDYDIQKIYEHWRSLNHEKSLATLDQSQSHNQSHYTSNFIEVKVCSPHIIAYCYACHEEHVYASEESIDELLNMHIDEVRHQNAKKQCEIRCKNLYKDILSRHTSNWYNISEYYCQICNKSFQSECNFSEHLDGQKHFAQLQNIRGKLIFDSCIVCAFLWIGYPQYYNNHCASNQHSVCMSMSITYDIPPDVRALCFSLNSRINELLDQSNGTCADRKDKEKCVLKSLEDTVASKYPKAKAYLFGSRISGLCTPASDLDIFLDYGEAYNGNMTQEMQQFVLNQIRLLLHDNKQNWIIDESIESSRTPIIKVKHVPTKIKCDISFGSGLSVENTKLIKSYNEAYIPCRKMTLFIKKWLSICQLSGSRAITNYSISWCVIFYLQNIGILPSVAELIKNSKQSKIISGWETGVSHEIHANNIDIDFYELLKGFFSFYTEFDYRRRVICPLTGEILDKILFLDFQRLPQCMEPYIRHIQEVSEPEFLQIDSPMCVQDPFDLSHNLTKGVKKHVLFQFKLMCELTLEFLQSIERK